MDREQKRIVLIGRSSAGKTTLCQFFSHEELRYSKTQAVSIVNKYMIDTPGEYLERRGMRGALHVTSADADLIVFVQDATEDGTMFPPAYSSMFAKPVIGVITKSDTATDKEIERAKRYLRLAGAADIFVTSSFAGTGFARLRELLGYD